MPASTVSVTAMFANPVRTAPIHCGDSITSAHHENEEPIMKNAPIRVLAADDHPLIRQGIAAMVSAEADMHMVAEAEDGMDAIEQCRKHSPDIVLMDVRMPRMDGIQATAALLKEFPGIRVMMMSAHPGDMQAMLALRAGARGYLLKSAVRRELIGAIRKLGEDNLQDRVVIHPTHGAVNDDSVLTLREVDVLEAVALGSSNAYAAAVLGIQVETVKSHLKSIFSKLDARDRTHAVVIGYRRGIIPSPPWP
jgi:DNA-binding NarL/FixJ family response regulator